MRICHCTLPYTSPGACERCNLNERYNGQNYNVYPVYPTAPIPYPGGSWVCSKCGRVYAYWVRECGECNKDKEK